MHGRLWFLVFLPLFSLACTEECDTAGFCGPGAYCSLGTCQTDCETNFDCGEGAGNTTFCSDDGQCIEGPIQFEDTDGASDPIGSGQVYILNRKAISDRGIGFDLDDKCGDEGCIDNLLSPLGVQLNDQLQQAIVGGSGLLLVEIAGLDGQSTNVSQDVTLKLYGAADADQPFFPANNFRTPPAYDTCCEFVVLRRWLTSTNQALARVPARIENGKLATKAPFRFVFPFFHSDDEDPEDELLLPLELAQAEVTFVADGQISGRLGGAAPVFQLSKATNPYCRAVSPRCPVAFPDATMLTLVNTVIGPIPDIDIDGDGLECVVDTDGDRLIDVCCDGAGSGNSSCDFPPGSCTNGATQIQSLDPNRPQACAESPAFADGYSIALEFDGVQASIVGVR